MPLVNRTCKSSVELNEPFLDESSYSLYTFAVERNATRIVSDKYKFGSFKTNHELISLSTWSRAKKYIYCGTPGYENRISHCNSVRYCEICARRACAKAYVRFEHVFNKAPHWYALTYSFKSNVFLTNTEACKNEYLNRWGVCNSFIRRLMKEGLVDGAFAVKELSIASLSGMAVFPHTHVVFNSSVALDLNNPLFVEELSSNPNISLKLLPVVTADHLLTEIKYPLKPLDLKAIYEQELINNPEFKINTGLDLILELTTDFEMHQQKVVYYGNMDARVKSSYIGTVMNSGKRATKSLKSSSISNTMNKGIANMPIYPPQQKKKSVIPGLLLGGGLGAAGLAGMDMLFNQGRGTGAVINSIKGLFNKPNNGTPISNATRALTPVDRSAPYVMPPARNAGAAVADVSAGYSGNHYNPQDPEAWKKYMFGQKLQGYGAGALNVPGREAKTVFGLPNSYSDEASRIYTNADGKPLTRADLLTGMLHSSDTEGSAFAPSFAPKADSLSSAVEGMDSAVSPITNAAYGVMLPVDAAAAAGGASLWGASKFFPNALDSSAMKGVEKGVKGIGALYNKTPVKAFVRGAGVLGGGFGGYQAGSNPLLMESLMDANPNLTPQQVLAISRGFGTGAGAVAGLHPAGMLAAPVASQLMDSAEGTVRSMRGSMEERGALGDVLLRNLQGVKAKNPHYIEATKKMLADLDANQGLTKRIQQGGSRSWLTGEKSAPSPVIQYMIDRARRAVQ